MGDTTAPEAERRRRALLQAAEAARFAPSIHNTQPWRWIVYGDRLELSAAAQRRLPVQDPDDHLLLLSCGTAVHHAQVTLDAVGWRYRIDRPAGSPVAVIHPTAPGPVDPAAVRHAQMLSLRHTDRRTTSEDPLGADLLDTLVRAAERAGARLHPLRRDQTIELAVLVEHAEKAERADEKLQAETAGWVGGERPEGAGVPTNVIPEDLPRTTVAERDFGTSGTLPAGPGHDSAATYAVLYGTGDEPVDWLRAGEALSAVWVTATEHGAGVLPLSSIVEVPFTRRELGRLLGQVGHPYLVLRIGMLDPGHAAPPRTPRLPVDQVIELRD
jgi:nitroreductase